MIVLTSQGSWEKGMHDYMLVFLWLNNVYCIKEL